jgi:hypothetical protein
MVTDLMLFGLSRKCRATSPKPGQRYYYPVTRKVLASPVE